MAGDAPPGERRPGPPVGWIVGGVLLVLVWMPVAVLALVFVVVFISAPEEYWLELGWFGIALIVVLGTLAIAIPVGAALLFSRARGRR